jgi:hypothetical protein
MDIQIQIFSNMNMDNDNFLADMNENTIFNLESDTDMNTDIYPDPNVFEIQISR